MSKTQRSIALLRGINVGKTKRMAMADLREALSELGYDDVQTLLQSGNVVFSTKVKADVAEKQIAEAIATHFGFDVSVLVRTAPELAKVVEENPFAGADADGKRFHVLFLSAKPAPATLHDVDPDAFAPEQLAVTDRELYVWCKNGVRESKLLKALTDKRLKVAITARNWNTVTKLLEMVRS